MKEKQTDFAGRLAYLRAIERVWKPAPLETLAKATPPVVAWLEPSYDMAVKYPDPPDGSRRIFLHMKLGIGWEWPRWSELLNSALDAPRGALMDWRSRYPIAEADSWIMDAALHTILQCWLDKSPLQWFYAPGEPWPGLFRPQYGIRWRGDDEADQKRIEKDLVNAVRRPPDQLGP